MFIDPAHKFPRVSTLVGNFLNLSVKEGSFDDFYCSLERFLVLKIS